MTADSTSPEPDEPETKGIERDKHGDPVLQGTRMIEKESYERVVEGLKMAADGSAHLAFAHRDIGELELGMKWANLAIMLDKIRLAAIDVAAIEDKSRFRGTDEIRRDPMPFMRAVDRVNNGFKQAAGGMRQLATCFRADYRWSNMATMVENLERKTRAPKRSSHPHLH